MRVVAVIQAHMGSTRLPGKVLKDINGEPMLACVVNRARRALMLDAVVIATTVKLADNTIVDLCGEHNWYYSRGSEEDVLDRYYRAAMEYKADVVVRITSDCPLIDPEIIDLVIREFLVQKDLDYASNTLPPRTFPRGLDVEVMTFEALAKAWREDHNPAWREHVTPYIYRHPENFKLYAVRNDADYSYMRWTVDTEEDLEFVRKIYRHFGHDRFSWHDVVGVLSYHPEWLAINQHIVQKEVP